MSALDLKTSPKLSQQQRLILTQDLQLFLKLIQMTTVELKDYLEEQLLENPALEEVADQPRENEEESETQDEEEIDLSEYEGESVLGGNYNSSPHSIGSSSGSSHTDDETPWESRTSSHETLFDHLRWQLKVATLSEEERKIASLIVGSTNEEGYLDADLEEIALLLVESEFNSENSSEDVEHFYENMGLRENGYLDKVENVLKRLQTTFDPPGVFARDLKECLRIQANDLGYDEDSTVNEIIENHLEDIGKKEYKDVAKSIGVTADEVEDAYSIISTLEPKPGRPFFVADSEKYIVPDFFVYKVGDELQIQLNRDFPRVRVSRYYRNLVKKQNNLPEEAKKYIKEKIEAAQRILKCLKEREATVRKIIKKIVEHQREFFEHGRPYIKPLRLKDIAHDEEIGVHESTVSRITSRRYIKTPRGTIRLKTLFSRKIETSKGDDISFEKVKAILRDIIEEEPPHSPYSDEDISNILKRKNIIVARRTVAKYRKILEIPSSIERAKEYREKAE